jgi:hypothetical protein
VLFSDPPPTKLRTVLRNLPRNCAPGFERTNRVAGKLIPRSAGRNTLRHTADWTYALCPNLEDVQLAARQKKAVLAFSELVFPV